MLTRLKVHGFKNLIAADVSFGPFTCIGGANGVGKSNLFDAILFLSALADKPLMESALSVRSEGGRSGDIRNIFHRIAGHTEQQIGFEAEMLVPRQGTDDLGQEAKASMTFLRYELVLELAPHGLTIRKETLHHITKGEARRHLPFPHSRAWRESVVDGRRTAPYISTEVVGDKTYIKLHMDGGGDYLGGGKPRPHLAERLPRTVLSNATNAAESPTVVLARREMQSWRLLQLEPSALRAPDAYNAPNSMETNGAHLPATLARLAKWRGANRATHELAGGFGSENHKEAVYASIANRLAELIDDVHSIRVEADDSRETLKLMLCDRAGTEHEARSLSDGTLRFLALAILESDPLASGVLCLEEPENGIHPQRIPAMLSLLHDLATNSREAIADTPLRQVIVNTHSPAVVAQVDEDDLLMVAPEITMRAGHRCVKPVFRWLEENWRARVRPDISPLSTGLVLSYLNPVEPVGSEAHRRQRRRRVVDRPQLQGRLFAR
ncbi:MAG: AAA family ATPase [Thermoanaerobaculia bacterium]|nr:AAA family ATPase [Thermoanaerobaculia bacterium]